MYVFFFFNDTATTEIYTLSLHDALPIYPVDGERAPVGNHGAPLDAAVVRQHGENRIAARQVRIDIVGAPRSEEHTSELQSQSNLVCRLLLEKKKTNTESIVFLSYHTANN